MALFEHGPEVVNPDHFLVDASGVRRYTPARGKDAWTRAWERLERCLVAGGEPLVVVCGVQGAGKSTWIAAHRGDFGEHAVFFDAALPRAIHRERCLTAAAAAGREAIAVWVDVPLGVCLRRNRARPADEVVPEEAVRSVAGAFEAPTVDEGFARVLRVRA